MVHLTNIQSTLPQNVALKTNHLMVKGNSMAMQNHFEIRTKSQRTHASFYVGCVGEHRKKSSKKLYSMNEDWNTWKMHHLINAKIKSQFLV